MIVHRDGRKAAMFGEGCITACSCPASVRSTQRADDGLRREGLAMAARSAPQRFGREIGCGSGHCVTVEGRASIFLRWSFGQPGLPQSFFISREVFGPPMAHQVFDIGNT